MSLISIYDSSSASLYGSNLYVTSGVVVGSAYNGVIAPTNSLIISGNVGIGTTNALAPLHIQVDASNITTNARVVRDFIDLAGNYPYLSTSNRVGSGIVVAPTAVTPGSGEGAVYIPGTTTDYLSLPNGSAAGIDEVLFTADFTIETWVYYITYPTTTISGGIPALVANGNTYWSFGVNYQGYIGMYWFTSTSTGQNLLSQGTVPLNKWTHIAVKYVASTKKLNLYINGSLQTLNFANTSATYVTGTTGSYDATLTTAGAIIYTNTQIVLIGSTSTGGFTNKCYISNLRFTWGNGTNPWTSPSLSLPLTNVTGTKILIRVGESTAQNYGPVLSAPPLMTLGSTNMSFYDASGTYDQIPDTMTTGGVYGSTFSPGSNEGSVYFSGVGSYLSFPPGSAANIANILAQDFTIEAWVNYTATQTSGTAYFSTLIINGITAGANGRWSFGGNNNNKLSFYFYNGAECYAETSTTISLNTWTHIAVSFIKTTKALQLFINGVAQTIGAGSGITGTGTTTATITTANITTDTTNPLLINTANSVGTSVYISNMRLTSGNNPWLTPSLTLPLASTAYTKLLLRANTTQALAPMYPPEGSAPLYAARAWISFNGVTMAVFGSRNISSVVRNTTGQYTIYFSTAMPNSTYSIAGSAHDLTVGTFYNLKTAYFLGIQVFAPGFGYYNSTLVHVVVFA
ncbi:hypothetical protein [Dishui Lake large algae virus 1]|nr:hypothetical protein [Dishui Lake large algae virus 1]